MGNLKKRRPILALVFSLVMPGLGQIYNGQFRKGLSYLVGFILAYALSSFLLVTVYGLILYLIIMIGLYIFILIDAVLVAKRSKGIAVSPFNRWYIYLIILLVSIVVPLTRTMVKNNIVRAYKMSAGSMAPTLLPGDRLLADMRIYKHQKPQRGDLIIFEYPKDPSIDYIKRVIAIDSEKVEIIMNKIYINDKPMDDPWGYFAKDYPALDKFGPVVVPKDSLFVLGDNRNNSQDSRFWGFLDIKKVKGKALYLYWAKDKSRIGMELK